MDRNTILFIVLSAGFLLLWLALFPPQPAKKPVAPASSAAPTQPAATSETMGTPPSGATPTGPGPSLQAVGANEGAPPAPEVPAGRRIEAAAEEEVVLDTPLVVVRLTNRGGRVTSWRLKHYLDDTGQPLELVSRAGRSLDHLPLQFLLDDVESTERLKKGLYTIVRHDETGPHAVSEVTLVLSDGAGLAATKMLRLPHDSYLASFRFAAESHGHPVEPTIVWGAGFGAHDGREKGSYADTTAAVVDSPGLRKPEKRAQLTLKPGEPWIEQGTLAWAGVEDKYFAAVFMPIGPAPVPARARFEILRLVEEGAEQLHLSMAADFAGVGEIGLFVGPKDYDILQGLHNGLDRLLDFGFFSVVARPLFYAMKFLYRHVGNYGWA